MIILRILLAGLALTLSWLIWAALADGSFAEAGNWLTTHPWGIVSLVDLYAGFLLVALIIWWFEPNKLAACFWIAPIPVLGNVWTLVWVLWRLPELRRRLKKN